MREEETQRFRDKVYPETKNALPKAPNCHISRLYFVLHLIVPLFIQLINQPILVVASISPATSSNTIRRCNAAVTPTSWKQTRAG